MRERLAALTLVPRSIPGLIVASLVVGGLSAARYFRSGYGPWVVLTWLLTIGAAGYAAFRANGRRAGRGLVARSDWMTALRLMLVFAPLYLAFLASIPYQISTDEVTVMIYENEASAQPGWDLFSLSGYFNFPYFIFVVYGWLGRLLGGVNLGTMRSVDAVVGLASIGVTYLVVRPALGKRVALLAAVLLGANHAMLAISRMAMRNNSALLVELVGLLFFLNGLKSNRYGWTYVGGAVAGIGFYAYEPARMLLVIWLAWMTVWVVATRSREARRRFFAHTAFGIAGCLLVIAPLVAGSLRALANPDAFAYQREQFMFFPEAQVLQQWWVDAPSLADGIRINITQGLMAYNSRVHDNGYVYYNPGHGFVDPLTGILLWVGVVWTFSRLREHRQEDYLVVTGFVLLWLTFSFITIRAPNYTRMLLTLPFVAYLAVQGIEFAAAQLHRLVTIRSEAAAKVLTAARLTNLTVIGIVLWNLGIYADYVVTGIVEREVLGATSRYIQARSADDDHAYFIAADKEHEFFSGGDPWHWEGLLRFLVGEDAHIEVVPTDLPDEGFGSGPFSVFTLKQVWLANAACFTSLYPHREVHPLTADGEYLAIEVVPTDQPFGLSVELCP